MTAAGWAATGAGGMLALGIVLALFVSEGRDSLRMLAGTLLVVVLAPVLVLAELARRSDVGTVTLSGRALARFARMYQRDSVDRLAWVFHYRGRGVIVLRRADRLPLDEQPLRSPGERIP